MKDITLVMDKNSHRCSGRDSANQSPGEREKEGERNGVRHLVFLGQDRTPKEIWRLIKITCAHC